MAARSKSGLPFPCDETTPDHQRGAPSEARPPPPPRTRNRGSVADRGFERHRRLPRHRPSVGLPRGLGAGARLSDRGPRDGALRRARAPQDPGHAPDDVRRPGPAGCRDPGGLHRFHRPRPAGPPGQDDRGGRNRHAWPAVARCRRGRNARGSRSPRRGDRGRPDEGSRRPAGANLVRRGTEMAGHGRGLDAPAVLAFR